MALSYIDMHVHSRPLTPSNPPAAAAHATKTNARALTNIMGAPIALLFFH